MIITSPSYLLFVIACFTMNPVFKNDSINNLALEEIYPFPEIFLLIEKTF
jgi:hypothetical protein